MNAQGSLQRSRRGKLVKSVIQKRRKNAKTGAAKRRVLLQKAAQIHAIEATALNASSQTSRTVGQAHVITMMNATTIRGQTRVSR